MLNKKLSTFFSIIILFFLTILSFYVLMPHDIKPINASETEFSAARSAFHIREMSKEMHPSGSEAIKNVRKYITSQLTLLGLDFHVQSDSVKGRYNRNKKIEVSNIISKINGKGQGKALLILAHYDSAKNSYGAGDDASGIATILETIRAYIATKKNSLNDIIILFTDGEEQGMLGAKLFVNKHPWAKDVGFAINFEARGTTGPSFTLVETNSGNANMIAIYANANLKYPLGTSLFYSIYKRMPNDGDSRILKEKLDINGFLFAFIDDHFNYHRPGDNYKNVSLTSVQHQGSYLLPLMKVFANINLSELKTEKDVVFFNVPILGVITYSYNLILILLILTIVLFISLIFYGFRLKKLSWKTVGFGFLVFILTLLISAFIGYIGVKIFPELNSSRFPKYGHLYTLSFVFLCIAIHILLIAKFCSSQSNRGSYMIAPILIWILLNIPISIYLKGASYIIIPVLFSLISLFFIFKQNKWTILITSLLAIPMITILSPMVKFLPLSIGPRLILTSTVLSTLMLSLLTGTITLYKFKRAISISFFLISLAIIIYIKTIN